MKQLVCIGCPRGCRLTVEKRDGEYIVTGNNCPRGRAFAVSEMTAPKRTVCSTVKTVFPGCPVLPVRVSDDIPKEKILDVMREINAVTLTERIGRGDVVIGNVLGLGVDVISTSDILKQNINSVSEGAK